MPVAGTPAAPSVRRCNAPAATVHGGRCRHRLDRHGPCPRHQDTDPLARCTATVRPGLKREKPTRCLAWPRVGSTLCPRHAPGAREVAREQARQRRARQARARALARLRPARDLAALLVVVLDAEIATPGGGGPALARFLAAP